MEIRSVEAAFICTPAGDCGDLNTSASLGISNGDSALIVTKIDLAALCSNSANCPQQSHDWLVDFYLVAEGVLGANQGEVSLGPYIYNKKSVQIVNESTLFRYAWLSVGGDEVDVLAAAAQNNSWDLKIEARLGQPAITKAASLPAIIALPASVLAGETEVPLGTVFSVSTTDASCLAGQLSVNAQYLIPDNGTSTGSLCIELDATDPVGNPALVVGGSIDLHPSYLKLPEGVFFRTTKVDSNPASAGMPYTTKAVPYLVPLFVTTPYQQLFNTYLHGEGWPFEFLLSAVALNQRGIEISYKDMRYVMEVGYSDQDPRKYDQLYSNDIYYRGVSGSGTLLLTQQGIDGAIDVTGAVADVGRTAFPKAQIVWQDFTQQIGNSRLQPVQMAVSKYLMLQSSACDGPGCDREQQQIWDVSSNNAKLDGEGYLLADAVNGSTSHQAVVFGARDNGVFAWTLPDDFSSQQNMKLALPGYVMPSDSTVSDYLLAHLNDTPADENLARYPLGSDAAVDGNYHPVGLSVGPEVYRDASGQPVQGDGQNLVSKNLTINNGVDAAFDLASSVAVKYVLRNAGVTGVFNVATSSPGASTTAQFYGYPLSLSRFAVRATDNQLDSYTWIDGQLALNGDAGGPGGLDIYFTNLEINCAARLGNVDLLYEACDGIDNNDNTLFDENCAPRLDSWQTDMDIFAAGFSNGESGQACATGTQNFTLNHQLFFAALNKPVAFETQWDKDGYLVEQSSGELPVYRFDRSTEGKGFPIKTGGAQLASGQVDGEGYGWLELANTKVGINFWNALDADLRLANRSQFAQLLAEPTVVLPAGQLTDQQDLVKPVTETNKQLLQRTIDTGIDLDAIYQWGNTGFGFTLPVYYQPYQLDSGNSDVDAEGRQSRFVGRTLSYDLFVLDANAGINFIEPERTKLSFGASADFERLGNISFQIDPTDPASAARVDDLLISVKIISTPLLAPALKTFLDTVNVINRAAGRGLDEAIKSGLELSLQEIGNAAATDPFVTASEALALLRSGPQQAITVLADELREPLNEELFSLEQDLRTAIDDLRIAADNEVVARADIVLGVLDEVIVQANAVDASIDSTILSTTDMIAQARSVSTQLVSVTSEIETVLRQSVSFVESSCNTGLVASAQGNGYLDPVIERFEAVRELADIIQNSNGLFDVAETLVKDSQLKSRLNTAKRRIREATTELQGYLNTADEVVRNVVCAEANIDEVIAKAFDLLATIRTQANLADAELLNAYVAVDQINSLHDTLSTQIISPLGNLYQALQQAKSQFETGSAVTDIVQSADCILYNLSSAGYDCTIVPYPPFVLDSGVDAIVATVFGSVRTGANQVISDAENAVSASIDGLLPGAYMTPRQLRELLVSEIMRSAPIMELRLTMDKHFAEIGSTVNGLVLQYIDQLNVVVQGALASVTGPVNDALNSAKSVVRGIPVQAASIDGFATIAGNELERAHIGAGWTMRGGDEDNPTGFKAALDAVSWSAKQIPDINNIKTPTACGLADSSSLLDVTISAYDLPLRIMSSDIVLEKLYLGFTLQQNSGSGPPLIPIGIFGGINTMGEIGFTDAVVIDPAFAAGLGELQTYVGASAAANFSSLSAEVAFLVGVACPDNVALLDLDPDVAKFITVPETGFKGAYLRGGVTIPILPGGCFLNLGVSADFGSWLLAGMPSTLGGLIGGGAIGELGCIASIKGKVLLLGEANTDGDLKLVGDAWGVAGAGFDCDPGTWTSVQRSRNDDWCGTGDAQTGAIFDNGKWDITTPSVDMLF